MFDDAGYISSCHIMTVPKEFYIPNWGYLLNNPTRSLDVLTKLNEARKNVLFNQFFSNEKWMKFTFGADASMDFDKFLELQNVGFNNPPSQFQLHLQNMGMPLTHWDHHTKFKQGGHFPKDRWFSFDFVTKCIDFI